MSRVIANGKSAKKIVFFEKRFEVPDYDNPKEVSRTRWRIIHTPWFGIYLHKWNKPDPRPTQHNHPWSFFSVILRGEYTEKRKEPNLVWRYNVIKWLNIVPRTVFHAVSSVTPETISLMFVGKTHEDWGYWNDLGYGDGYATSYENHPDSKEFSKAMKARKEFQENSL